MPDALHIGNIHHNKPIDAALTEHTHRCIVINAAVQVFRAVGALIVQSGETCGQHQIIHQKPLLHFFHKQLNRF